MRQIFSAHCWPSTGFVWILLRFSFVAADEQFGSVIEFIQRAGKAVASIKPSKQTVVYYARFRLHESAVNRALNPNNRREAEVRRGAIEEIPQLLHRGRIACPPNTCPVDFVMAGGKAVTKKRSAKARRLKDLFQT